MPSEADWCNGGIGQAAAGVRVDFSALDPVVGEGREQHRVSIKAAQQLLRGDHTDTAGGCDAGERCVPATEQRVAVGVFHFIGAVDINERSDDVHMRRWLRTRFQTRGPLDVLVANCACVGAAPMTIARSVFVATFHKNPRMSASVTVETGRVMLASRLWRVASAGCGATMRSQASA